VLRLHPQDFRWKPPPYEYEFEKLPIDLIIGDRDIRQRIESQEGMEAITALWQDEVEDFRTLSREFYLYT